jgi:flagellar hook assembly protein FlgD
MNGAGVQVFSTTNDGNDWKNWDGKNSKGIDMPEGTYYYILKITSRKTGTVTKESGFIILKRY